MNELESTIKKMGHILADRQLARIYKIPEDFIQTPCDFFGYTSKGRAILIEAKMRDKTSLSVGSDIKPHQWIALKEGMAAGCIPVVMWQKGEEIALISPYLTDFQNMKERKSISWKGIRAERRCKANPVDLADKFCALYKHILKDGATQIASQTELPSLDQEQ